MVTVSNGVCLACREGVTKNGKAYFKILIYEGEFSTTVANVFPDPEDLKAAGGYPGEGQRVELQGRIWSHDGKNDVFWNRFRIINDGD